MLRDARRALGARDSRFSFAAFDCEKIPAASESYDLVIANHVLFYCDNLENVCKEVRRVLKPGGRFLCSTYGNSHMKEISQLVSRFDERIVLSANKLYEKFGRENGAHKGSQLPDVNSKLRRLFRGENYYGKKIAGSTGKKIS